MQRKGISNWLFCFVIMLSFNWLAFGQGSNNVPLLVHINDYPSVGYNDCWGYTAPDGREYALLGVQNGTSIVDITDPANAVEVAFIPSSNSTWKDVKTFQHYAYVVTDLSGNGIQIIDLSDLPNSAHIAATYSAFSTSHNIYIDVEAELLLAQDGGSAPVRILSLADPLNPVELSTLGVECHDVFAQDGVAYVAEGGQGTIGIFDISNPNSPSLIQRVNIPSPGYAHNVWVSEDNNYMMTTEETTGKTIKLWDISNINNPTITDQVLAPDGLAHNAHIKGNFAYVSHYTDGLRIYDISDPQNITEAGFYDTYPGPGGGFNGAWGAFPYFISGKLLISDIQTGLYVVFFQGAVEADSLDPHPPEAVTAYSDYTTPSSITLSWDDPTNLFNGDTLLPSQFTIEVLRDSVPVGSAPGGTENFTDSGLNDGQLYTYTVFTKVTANDSTSRGTNVEWIAGGAPTPSPPASFFVTSAGNELTMHWTNPFTNIDGTPADDFAGIKLYEDGNLVGTFTRTSADTGRADSATYTPPSGTHQYYVTAYDDESPSNESDPSNTNYSPLSLPFSDNFPTAPDPNPGFWINTNAEVNNLGVNPPSPSLVLSLDGHPDGGDQVTLLPVDLSNAAGDGIILSFWYQPQGSGNDPESGDSLAVDFLNDQGDWVTVRNWPGTSVVPFVNEVINLDSQNPGPGATFFYPAFQFRFRNIGTSSSSSHFDHWLIDDVFFGLPTNTPIMAVNPQSLSDTLLAGATNTLQFEISNTNSLPSNLNFTVAENPAVDWLSVSPSSGTIASSGTQSIDVQLDASGLSSGAFTTDLVVSGDDPNNTNDTVVVNLEVNDAPVVGVSADSIEFALDPNQTDSTVMTITNSGGGPLHFQLSDEDVFPETTLKPVIHMPEPQHELSLDFGKGEEDWRRGVSPHYGLGGPDNFGYRWIDSDEPNGPVFNWQDISGVGTAVSLNDDDFIEVQLPFSFSFYGNMVDMIKISSNGYLTFGADGTDFSNDPIPDPLEPNHIIAPFWDDLNPTIGGTIHYHSDANQFIVQYTNIQHFGGSAPYTFQVILDSNGKILYQYLDMQGDVTSATIGIENVDASDGLEVAFNAPYVHDNLAVRIAADTPWLSENPTNGTVPAGGTLDVQVIADAAGLSSGDYHARIIVASNDPQNSELEVPVNLQVGSFARITTSPDSVIFSDTVVVNQQATQSLFIHNLGNADLNVSEMLSTSAVFSANPQQVLVPPGDSVNVTVTYAPTAAGQDSGLLQLVSNDPNHDTLGVYMEGIAALTVGIGDDNLPREFAVSPNYPNPFNPSTTINYQLPEVANVTLTIYNVLGQRIRTLVDQRMEPGYHQVVWDGRNEAGAQVSSGIYVYRFTAGAEYSRIHKMIFLK